MLREPSWFGTQFELVGESFTWMFVVESLVLKAIHLRLRILSDPRGIRSGSAASEELAPSNAAFPFNISIVS